MQFYFFKLVELKINCMKKESKILVLILALMAIFAINAKSQTASQMQLARPWSATANPVGAPASGFTRTDILNVTSTKTSWMYNFTSRSWYQVDVGYWAKADPVSFGKIKFVSNQNELQAAVLGFENGTTSSIHFMNDIGTTSMIVIPKIIGLLAKSPCIYLEGNTLFDASPGGLPILIGRLPSNQNEALNLMQDVSVIIRDGGLRGKAGTGTLVDLGATYASVVQAVKFNTAKNGSMFRFCLMANQSNCLFNNIGDTASAFTIGNWLGASAGDANAQSNSSYWNQCRVLSKAGSKVSFFVGGSSNVDSRQLISESNPTSVCEYDILRDDLGSRNVFDGKDESFHPEHRAVKANIEVRYKQGTYVLDGCYPQYGGVLFSAVSKGAYPIFEISRIGYLPADCKLQTSGGGISVYSKNNGSDVDLSLASNWVNGVLPTTYAIEGFQGAPDKSGIAHYYKYSKQFSSGKTNITGATRINNRDY